MFHYSRLHFLDFFFTGGSKAATIASSKTFFNPTKSVVLAKRTVQSRQHQSWRDCHNTSLCQRTTLDIFDCAKLSCKSLACIKRDGSLFLSGEFFQDCWVVSQINLGSDNQTRHTGTMVMNFREPLLLHVLKRCWGSNAEANKKNICLGIRQGSQTIIIFLACFQKQKYRVMHWVGGGGEYRTPVC